MRTSHSTIRTLAVFLCSLAGGASALTVTNPPVGSSVVAAGVDFATEQIGNPWDMSDPADVRTNPQTSQQLTAPQISQGLLTATTNGGDPWFYAYFGGFISSAPTSIEARHRINTSRYRFLTVKIRYRAAGGGPLGTAQPIVVYFLNDTSYSPGSFNNATPIGVAADTWQIATLDLNNGGAPLWQSFPTIGSLRFDPTVNPNVQFEVDWIRLTAPPTDASTSYAVSWTDTSGGPYAVTAIDPDGARFVLATGVNGNNVSADFSRLAPGNYTVEVSRTGATALSPGVVRVNSPPLLDSLTPNIRGDQSRNFALLETGNAWGPIDATDITGVFNTTNLSYSNPPNSLSARPTNNDPYVFFNLHGQSINASRYRSLCITQQVFGPQSVGVGSVTRLFWGNVTLASSDDIVVEEGTNEYCIADMSTLATEPPTPGSWSGTIPKLRVDPHEFPVSAACTSSPSAANCHDFRIDSLVLSPFYTAHPMFTFRWNHSDADTGDALIQVFLDPDQTFANGNEIFVGSTASFLGAGELSWAAPNGITPGLYNVVFVANDGTNANPRYAEGPLLISSTAPSDTILRDGFE